MSEQEWPCLCEAPTQVWRLRREGRRIKDDLSMWCPDCGTLVTEDAVFRPTEVLALRTRLAAAEKALKEVWAAEEPEGYFEGPESDYGGYALRCRKAWELARAYLTSYHPDALSAPESTEASSG